VSLLPPAFRLSTCSFWDSLPTSFLLRLWLSGLRTALGNMTTQAEVV
jgi:hypothetical protein